jgi:uncharacterized protein
MTEHREDLTPDLSAFVPMLDLFVRARQAGMHLTIEQYDLLRQALATGAGLADWDDLRDVCRMLWVKPSLNYDAEVFDQVFDDYQADYQDLVQRWIDQQTSQSSAESGSLMDVLLGVLPKIPPRTFQRQATSDGTAP